MTNSADPAQLASDWETEASAHNTCIGHGEPIVSGLLIGANSAWKLWVVFCVMQRWLKKQFEEKNVSV